MLRILLKISSLIDSLSERVGNVSVWLVIITVLVGFYNVVVRYLGQYIGVQLTSNLLIELQWYLFSLVFFLGFAYILKNGINVRVASSTPIGAGDARQCWISGGICSCSYRIA